MDLSRKTVKVLFIACVLSTVGAIGASQAIAYQPGTDFNVDGTVPLGNPGTFAFAHGRFYYEARDAMNQPDLYVYRASNGSFATILSDLSMPRTDTLGRLWAWDTANGRFVRIDYNSVSDSYTQAPGPTPPAEAQPFQEFAVGGDAANSYFYLAMDGAVKVLDSAGAVLQTFAPGAVGQTRVAVTDSKVVVGTEWDGWVRIYSRGADGSIGSPYASVSGPNGWTPGSPLRIAAYGTAQGSANGELFIGYNDTVGTPERRTLNGVMLPRPQYTGTANPQALYFTRNPVANPATLFQFATPPAAGNNLFIRYGPDATGLSANVTFNPPNPSPGASVQFNSNASGGTAPYTYSWNFGDGSPPSSEASPTHSYAVAGSYNVSLDVTDSANPSNTINRAATVTVSGGGGGCTIPTANFTFAPNSPAAGQSVNFDGSASCSPSGSIDQYRWNWGDGSPLEVSPTPQTSHTFANAGTYNVRLTVMSSAGQADTIRIVTVGNGGGGGTPPPQPSPCPNGGGGGAGPNAAPTAGFTIDLHTGRRSTASFDGSPSQDTDGCIVDYVWDFGDGSGNFTGKEQTHTYAQSGLYTVVLRVTDDSGASTTTSMLVFVLVVTDPSSQPAEPGTKPGGAVGRRPHKRQKLPRLRKAPDQLAGKVTVGTDDPEVEDVYVALSRRLTGRGCAWYEPGIPAWVRKKGCDGQYRLWFSVWDGKKNASSAGDEITWKVKLKKSFRRPQGTYCLSVRVKFVDGTMWTKVPGVTYQCYRVKR